MHTKTGVLKREQLGIKSLSFKGKMVGSVPTKSIYFGIFFGKWVKIKNRYATRPPHKCTNTVKI